MSHLIKNLVRGLTLVLILVLTVLSIYGAVIGTEKAAAFFSSPVMAVFWSVLLATTLLSLLAFPRLLRKPGLLSMHLGFALILIGSMRNSERGHEWAARRGAPQVFRRGYMQLQNGERTSAVFEATGRMIARFPLDLHLKRFSIDYYETSPEDTFLYVGWIQEDEPEDEDPWIVEDIPWRLGQIVDVPGTDLKLHFRDADKRRMGADMSLYSLEVALIYGREPRVFVLQAVDDHTPMRVELSAVWPEIADLPESISLMLAPPNRSVQLYKSQVTFMKLNEPFGEADIIVNRPARMAGYHIYQHSWGINPESGNQPFTRLLVASYAGMTWVYLGFILVSAGTFIHCWFPKRRRQNKCEEKTA